MAQYAHYSELTPEIAAIYPLPPSPVFDDVHVARQMFTSLFSKLKAVTIEETVPGGYGVEIGPSHTTNVEFSESAYTVKDYQVPVDDGEILIRNVIPISIEGEDGTYPLFVWFHAGGPCFSMKSFVSVSQFASLGFVMGDVNMDDTFLRQLSVQLRVAVVNVDYRCVDFAFD